MQILKTLQELASLIEIESSNFVVNHPLCQQPKIPANIIEQLKKLPEKVQDEYFISMIQKLIFGIYSTGKLVLANNESIQVNYDIGLEDAPGEVDWEFYDKLHQNNYGRGSWNPNFLVLRQENDGSLAVEKKDIITHIQPEYHLRLQEQSATVGDVVSIPRPSSHIRNYFYIAYSDLVYTWAYPSVFVYFNFSPEGAIVLMRHLTQQLNALQVAFDFNVLYNPSSYGRYDSGILRINKDSYEVVGQVLQAVYNENALYFKTNVPIFTKMLAPGLAIAERPQKEFRFLEDFGMNRCKIIANALLDSHKNGDESPESRMKYIFQYFHNYEVDLENPYLNPNSEDIYTPLNVTRLANENQAA
jgi:HopA1 effector protein family